jgi:hypothetical protein
LQFAPTQGVGKSSHVSQCAQPIVPAATAIAAIKRFQRAIAVSFPQTEGLIPQWDQPHNPLHRPPPAIDPRSLVEIPKVNAPAG